MDRLWKTCVVGAPKVLCAWRLPLQGVPAYLGYLVAMASLSQSSLRLSLAYLIYLPWRVCPVGAPLVAHEGHFPPLGVLAYLGGRLVPWEGAFNRPAIASISLVILFINCLIRLTSDLTASRRCLLVGGALPFARRRQRRRDLGFCWS